MYYLLAGLIGVVGTLFWRVLALGGRVRQLEEDVALLEDDSACLDDLVSIAESHQAELLKLAHFAHKHVPAQPSTASRSPYPHPDTNNTKGN